MGKLHEVLAVEADLKGKSEKIVEETKTTFTKKSDHFHSLHKTYKTELDEEKGLDQPEEMKTMVETVRGKLSYTAETVTEYLDVFFQKEAANTQAKADLTLEDGSVLVKDVPATVLLGLETKLRGIREVYDAIPTLPPGEDWTVNANTGHHRVAT